MGRYTGYMTCDDTKSSRSEMLNVIILDVRQNGDVYEGTDEYNGSLLGSKAWHGDKIFDSYNEARSYLASQADYDDSAVKYREYNNLKDANEFSDVKRAHERANKAFLAYRKIQKNSSLTNRKAKFITCSNCESRFKPEYVAGKSFGLVEYRYDETGEVQIRLECRELNEPVKSCHFCPVCGADLWSDTVKARIASASDKLDSAVEDYSKTYMKRTIAERKKAIRSSKIRWIAKYEIHC